MRHICGISGGKDSSALAIYMRDKVPDMEHVFADTGKELPETYEYLVKLEGYLGKPIKTITADVSFDDMITERHGGMLPSSMVRWCTREMKIRPFEEYIGGDEAYLYIGIRADEERLGYKPVKTVGGDNITPKYPFQEDNLKAKDIYEILDASGVGVPEYYKWRTRSGCYFCFYQRRAEWVGLLENHPILFEASKTYEKDINGEKFTWRQGRSLTDIEEQQSAIKKDLAESMEEKQKEFVQMPLSHSLAEALDDEDDDVPCAICHL